MARNGYQIFDADTHGALPPRSWRAVLNGPGTGHADLLGALQGGAAPDRPCYLHPWGPRLSPPPGTRRHRGLGGQYRLYGGLHRGA